LDCTKHAASAKFTVNLPSLYTQIESQLASWSAQRDAIASQIRDQLDQAEFGGKKIDEQLSHRLLRQAHLLLDDVHAAAN
jgi:hypothetical protein